MSFSISPHALDVHGSNLINLAELLPDADGYATTHVSLTLIDTSFLYARVIGYADAARDAVIAMHADLGEALTLSGNELKAIAARSRELDDAIEAELDSAYPDQLITCLDETTDAIGNGPYQAPVSPRNSLSTPVDQAPFDLVTMILKTEWFSPSYWISELIGYVFSWNPVTEVTQVFSGDWAALYTADSALTKLGDFHAKQGENITFAMALSANTWEGEAAEAANIFFTNMARLSDLTAEELRTLGPEFKIVAMSMESAAGVVSGLINQVLDLLIVAAVIYAAGAATSATGVGAIVGALGGSAALVRAVMLAEEAWSAISKVVLVIDSLGAVIGVFESFAVNGATFPKPVPYDNPEV